MTPKENTPNTKKAPKLKTIRISSETEKKHQKLVRAANKKSVGRKVKFDQLIYLAMDLVTDECVKKLQDQTLKNEDRMELLRQKYISTHGHISKDEFIGFTMTPEYFEFLKEQQFILRIVATA